MSIIVFLLLVGCDNTSMSSNMTSDAQTTSMDAASDASSTDSMNIGNDASITMQDSGNDASDARSDAGTAVDAGSTLDASTPVDAGSTVDASSASIPSILDVCQSVCDRSLDCGYLPSSEHGECISGCQPDLLDCTDSQLRTLAECAIATDACDMVAGSRAIQLTVCITDVSCVAGM